MPIRTTYKYPLDLTGNNPDNRVNGEKHTIGTSRNRLFIAEHGPFYGNTVVVRDSVSGDVLEPIADYLLVHQVREAQEITGQPVYCGVRVVNVDINTEIEIDVSYVGGEFSYTTKALIAMLEAIINDNRPIDWGEIIGIPNEWVPAPHLHSAYDLYAMKHLVGATSDVAAAIREGHLLQNQMLFDMIDERLTTFEDIIPRLIQCYEDGERLLATLL